ncbi:IS1 family transposase [Pectobacterium brasiliense]|uniref:IS1 family transposase n=1 Tax=Pectobacterium brasiliense TaxID=180957 RepID=UPI00358DC294
MPALALVRIQHQGRWWAYTFGSRIDETCCELLELLMPFNIGMIISDVMSGAAMLCCVP